MSFIYITEHDATIGIDGGHFQITHKDKSIDVIPKQLVEGISIFGKSQLTATAIQYCLEKGIRVGYFSHTGNYYGCLSPNSSVNIQRLKNQILVTEDENRCIEISKNIIHI